MLVCQSMKIQLVLNFYMNHLSGDISLLENMFDEIHHVILTLQYIIRYPTCQTQGFHY